MTLLTVTREVCAAVGVSLPTSVFSGINANRTMQEMLALANEMVQRIGYDTRDWTGLTEIQTFTGNGTVTAFPMPANFKRMLKLGMIWQWKANKGAPYAEDMGSYSDALTNNMGSDRPAPTFVGHAPISAAAKVAIPWPASWGPQP